MSDLISRKALLEWINEQREAVTKKQVAGISQSIFKREDLVAMQRCLSAFETKIKNQPTAYDVEKVVEGIEEFKEEAEYYGFKSALSDIVGLVKWGAVE